MKTIGIIGLGVMGASFAARLSQQGISVIGFDKSEDTIQTALKKGIIQKGTTHPKDYLSLCDQIVICLYPTQIETWIQTYQSYLSKNTLLMEISGVKTGILAPLQEMLRSDLEIISIHPMCGRESRGIEYSDPAIFDQANYIVIPTEKNSQSAIDQAVELGKILQVGHIATLSVEEHDRMIGFLSQLTHVIAVSLMNTHENSHLVEYTGDSFRDLTRIAEINEDLWAELFLLNKEILLDETDQFIASIKHFRDALESEDTEEMKRLFIQSTKRRKLFNR